jgi:hypothetical protein
MEDTLSLLYINPVNKHDITIIKEDREDFVNRFEGCIVLLDKEFIDKGFGKEMDRKGRRGLHSHKEGEHSQIRGGG